MSGAWKGWQSWNRFEEAGIVENDVDFSDEPIIVDHAIGRTRDAIRECWPMDAAVAYTLMKGGPDARLTWSDMVNTYTRSAAVMMTGKVGYGKIPSLSTPSCGHDEIDGFEYHLAAPKVTDDRLQFVTSWSGDTFAEWIVKEEINGKIIPKHIKDFAVFRLRVRVNLRVMDLALSPFFAPLREYFRGLWGNLSIKDGNIIKDIKQTKGVCLWAKTKTCCHHDRVTSYEWAMSRTEDGFQTVWRRAPCTSTWNRNQWETMPAKSTLVSWDEVRRSMAQNIPEKEVIKHIRDSLTRMLKRNDNIVSKEGRGKNSIHYWSDWGWLAEMAAYVNLTNSKKRNEDDIENGWRYTKTRSRYSYGHEIADFVWKPVDILKDYLVGREEVSDWRATSVMSTLRFSSKEAVIAFMETVADAHLAAGGHYSHRTHDGFEKIEHGKWSVRSIPISFSMKGSVDPEDYLSPQDALTMWRQASPVVFNEHKDNFEVLPDYKIEIEANDE